MSNMLRIKLIIQILRVHFTEQKENATSTTHPIPAKNKCLYKKWYEDKLILSATAGLAIPTLIVPNTIKDNTLTKMLLSIFVHQLVNPLNISLLYIIMN